MTKIVRNDEIAMVLIIENIALVRFSENWNDFLRFNSEEFKPVRRSAIAMFATKYAPFDVKIVDLYLTIAIKSMPFRTSARIATTIVKISNHVRLVSSIPRREAVLFNIAATTPPVVFSLVIISGFPFSSPSD